jgi:hypothetical protein
MLCNVLQVAARMKDARVVAQGAKAVGNVGRAADADHQVAREPLDQLARVVARAHAQQRHLAALVLGQHLEHFLAVGAGVLELLGRPREVVVELVPAGEEALQVDEIGQPAFFMQVVDEGEATGRVAQRGQVLHEGDLHVRVVQQHVRVPGEARLLLDEQRVERPGRVALLLERDGQGDVGRAEPDPDQIMDVWHGNQLL